MKVLHAISGIWEKTGGPAESVPRLCSALNASGTDILIMTLKGNLSSAALECKSEGIDIATLPHYKQISLSVFKTGMDLIKGCDIVHGHGVWQPLNWAAGRAAYNSQTPMIITPRGSLNPNALKHSRLKKKIVSRLFDMRYLKYCQCIHVTSHDEYLAVRQYGLTNPIAVIPNGVHIEDDRCEVSELDFRHKFKIPEGKRIILFLSRISWEKGLEDLANAWNGVANDFRDWHLVIAGAGEKKYISVLQKHFNSNTVTENVTWVGALFGDEKKRAYSSASIFILPSHTENFSLVVAEALAAGIPVITTEGTPWSELPEKECGWWVPVGVEGIRSALNNALNKSEQDLSAMGAKGKALIDEQYAWSTIAGQMNDVYEWVLGNRERPPFVIID